MSGGLVVAALALGALGAALRYAVTLAFAGRPARLPWAVLVVNVAGSAVAGAVLGLSEAGILDAALRYVIVSGFCAGLTTFSTFSVETVQLVLERRARAALASVASNLVLGVGAAALAWAAARALAG
ncbi:fluoride efflux transporter FluC [Homoserinibacter sp. YIM 151385]|uniref:fluoride efflux transporter FluC n=1 Tax=Homoserinibacter sp. YIM 151385 TaxID=2985506 RepID=UPI0022F0CF14|nr:CrcB family protein [Homoserinibacter sp. YIM 151385]WBU37399.1 CrcB family protein [Homoserinibacter sp. YIM 151385]